MKCPHDNKELVVQANSTGGYSSYDCLDCGGSWLPPKFFNAIRYSRRFDVAAFKASVEASDQHVSDIACPSGCGLLNKVDLTDVEIECCPRCQGLWFDRHEILAAFTQDLASLDDSSLPHKANGTGFWESYKNLRLIHQHILRIPGVREKPAGSLKHFLSSTRYAISLVLKEKEILFFAFLQWVAIAMAYLLWIQMLDWIPEEVWRSAAESDGGSPVDWVLMLWSIVCVGLAAYPVGIFSGCMGAAHFLRQHNLESTIRSCLYLVLPRAGSLWAIHWFDGWITVKRIVERLPSKDDRRTLAERAADEARYYIWKVGISGILPAILVGDNLLKAGKSSIFFVKDNLLNVAMLRAGYSLMCWIVGIAGYIGAIFWFAWSGVIDSKEQLYGRIYEFYLWATGPIVAALVFVVLFLRPIYVITLCHMYSEYKRNKGDEVVLPESSSKITNAFLIFMALCVITACAFVFREELGIVNLLSMPYE